MENTLQTPGPVCRFTLAQQLRCAAEGLNVTKQHETHGGNRLIGYEKLNHSNDGTDGEKAPPIKQKQFLGSLSHHPLLVRVMRSAELNPIAPTERVRCLTLVCAYLLCARPVLVFSSVDCIPFEKGNKSCRLEARLRLCDIVQTG